jgi:type IV secretion system protein TrbL
MVALKASAAGADVGVMDDLVDQYHGKTGAWFSKLFGYAQTLFAILATIEVAWSGIVWALEKDQMQSWVAALVRKIMTIGFFYALLLHADTWIPAIIDSLVMAGQNAGGTGSLSPSSVVAVGMDCFGRIMEAVGNLGFMDRIAVALPAEFCGFVILLSFVWIACHLAVALIESFIAISANVLFLGFGGSRWTLDFVNKVLGYAVSTGLKLFMLYLMIGLGMTEANDWANALTATTVSDNYLSTCAHIVCGAVFFAYLSTKIPALAASMLNGSPTLTAGDAAGTVAGMAAGAVALGAMSVNGKSIFEAAKSGNGPGAGTGGLAAVGTGRSVQNASALGLSSSSNEGSSAASVAKAAPVMPPPSLPPSSGGSSSSPARAAAQTEAASAPTQAMPASAPPAEAPAASGTSSAAQSGESDAPAPVAAVPPPALPASSTGTASSTSATPAPAKPSASSPASTSSSLNSSDTAPPVAAVPPPVIPGSSPVTENAIGSAGGDQVPQDSNQSNETQQPRASKREEFDRLRRELPHDQAGGGTVHIKLDYGHE